MKKGSLSLSVNAIVVLILAITMLGLGLGFMKGMFGKVSTQVDKAISVAELDNPPTQDEPMTLSFKDTTVRKGDTVRLDVGFLNTGTAALTSAQLILTCTGPTTPIAYTAASPRAIPLGKSSVLSVLFDTTLADLGTNLCTVNVMDGTTQLASKDVFVRVR